jgi:hypothetical protein
MTHVKAVDGSANADFGDRASTERHGCGWGYRVRIQQLDHGLWMYQNGVRIDLSWP